MAAQSGPAGKAARTVGRRPGEALTQPNPTQPLGGEPSLCDPPPPLKGGPARQRGGYFMGGQGTHTQLGTRTLSFADDVGA